MDGRALPPLGWPNPSGMGTPLDDGKETRSSSNRTISAASIPRRFVASSQPASTVSGGSITQGSRTRRR